MYDHTIDQNVPTKRFAPSELLSDMQGFVPVRVAWYSPKVYTYYIGKDFFENHVPLRFSRIGVCHTNIDLEREEFNPPPVIIETKSCTLQVCCACFCSAIETQCMLRNLFPCGAREEGGRFGWRHFGLFWALTYGNMVASDRLNCTPVHETWGPLRHLASDAQRSYTMQPRPHQFNYLVRYARLCCAWR